MILSTEPLTVLRSGVACRRRVTLDGWPLENMDPMTTEERKFWSSIRAEGYRRYLGHSIRHGGAWRL